MILERLRADGKVVAAELSAALAVSPDTVRRDLRELAEAGLLRRVHGGALPAAVGARPYAARLEQAPDAKAAIARSDEPAPARRPGDPARRRARRRSRSRAACRPTCEATVITNSPPIAVALAEHPRVEVVVLGGIARQGRARARRRRDRRGAALRARRRARARRLQPAPRDRDHRARPRGVVREARDDRERGRGRRGLVGRQARLRGAVRDRAARRADPPRHRPSPRAAASSTPYRARGVEVVLA